MLAEAVNAGQNSLAESLDLLAYRAGGDRARWAALRDAFVSEYEEPRANPTRRGYSREAISELIGTEIEAGKPQDVAAAIAYEQARRSWRAEHGRAPYPDYLRRRKNPAKRPSMRGYRATFARGGKRHSVHFRAAGDANAKRYAEGLLLGRQARGSRLVGLYRGAEPKKKA